MPVEPILKRAIAFFDGQNLFYAAKYAFGYPWPLRTLRTLPLFNLCGAAADYLSSDTDSPGKWTAYLQFSNPRLLGQDRT